MQIKLNTFSFRRLETPLDEKGVRLFTAVVKADNFLDEIYQWRGINPRDPKTNSFVAKEIAKTANESPDMFLFKNRGLVLMADKVEFDNKNALLTLTLTDRAKHGLLDGGHTCKVLIDELKDIEPDKRENIYLKLEILEGFKENSDIVDIVEARNTSTQVKDQSLMNLLKKFEDIDKVLRGEAYADSVAYKENELNDEEGKKPIDIRDIVSYLVCFDIKNYGQDRQPDKAYSSKAAALTHFDQNLNDMKKIIPLTKDILRLRDTIYKGMPALYNRNAGQGVDAAGNSIAEKSGGKFGRLTGVLYNSKKAKWELHFIGEKSKYGIPNGFVYPILAAFRSLLKEENGRYVWKRNPFEVFELYGKMLVLRVCERALDLKNPNKLGKETALWRGCYEGLKLAILDN